MTKLLGLLPALLLAGCAAPVAVGYQPGTTDAQRDQLHRTTAAPQIAESSELVATTSVQTFDVPVAEIEQWFLSTGLEEILRGSESIPAVRGTVALSDAWGHPGDRRRVELDDDSTALEQVLASEFPSRFHYVVWNYTSDVAKYVEYGVGEFRFEPVGDKTRVTWTYAFAPKKKLYKGPLRRFVQGEYREFMDESLGHMKASAESRS